MKYTLSTLALAAAALANPISADSAAPTSVSIEGVVYGGTGCPQGSINITWTDKAVLPIKFGKDFTAKVGADVSADQSRKNCQLNLKLDYDPGFSFAIYQADYAGYVSIDAGVSATIKSTYYFSGETDQTSSAFGITGPFKGKYLKTDAVVDAVWSPCGSSALLNVNAEVDLTPLAGGNGLASVTREDGRFTSNLYIYWKQC